MPLTGHLSDLSLSELIEFFCNQRKTGRLKVLYPQGPGYFYLHTGSVVDARVGVLKGIDAVYFALTLPNAAFEFAGNAEATEKTINQPWTQVVLEGLRRLDEGMVPPQAFPEGYLTDEQDIATPPSAKEDEPIVEAFEASDLSSVPAFLAQMNSSTAQWRRPLVGGAVAAAVLVSVAVIGVPAGWYGKHKPAATVNQNVTPVSSESPSASNNEAKPQTATPESDTHANDAAALAAKRQREREKAKAREANAAAGQATVPRAQNTGAAGPKKATVQVTYDESGRVTQASGADPTAVRIARQKRFPPGKAGTATITIPLN
jgi:hypothetical protein